MTLEGEYYFSPLRSWRSGLWCRNPHDIGRRILHRTWKQCRVHANCRNPHDIGRRILPIFSKKRYIHPQVAILMTLEGEYYHHIRQSKDPKFKSRNPHDIGRRILHIMRLKDLKNLRSRNPHDIGRRILQEVHQHKITYR